MTPELPAAVPPTWSGFFDDAAIFPPGHADLPEAVQSFRSRRDEWYADLVASLVVTDEKVPAVTAAEIPLGVLTALVGAPVFAVLLRRHQRGAAR